MIQIAYLYDSMAKYCMLDVQKGKHTTKLRLTEGNGRTQRNGNACSLNACDEKTCWQLLDKSGRTCSTANLGTNTVDFRGFDSSIILILRGGIVMSIGDLPESLSQAILGGIMLVGKTCSSLTVLRRGSKLWKTSNSVALKWVS